MLKLECAALQESECSDSEFLVMWIARVDWWTALDRLHWAALDWSISQDEYLHQTPQSNCLEITFEQYVSCR